jgi:hypothetical protein
MRIDDEHAEARAMVSAASPLERVMFLFNQPPGMATPEMRRKAAQVLGVGVALQVFVFWVTPDLMRVEGGPGSKVLMFVVLAVYGTAFLLVPASLFRIIYGVTYPHDGNGIVRGFVAFGLFLLSCFASCSVYGALTK